MVMQILISIGAGIIVSLILPAAKLFRDICCRVRLRRIFGSDFRPDGNYHVAYAPLEIRQDFLIAAQQRGLEKNQFPYWKKIRASARKPFVFTVDSAVATSEFRSAKYLATFFARHAKMGVTLSADIDFEETLDASWVSLGGQGGNIKSNQTQEDPDNNLINLLSASTFISATEFNGLRCVIKRAEQSDYDYGLILRIRAHNFPRRVHIACMGFSERGTSGAVWFLCNKWKKLWPAAISWDPRTWIKGKNFAAIIKVRKDSDESAILLSKDHLVNSPDKVFKLCDGLCSLWYDESARKTLGENRPTQMNLFPGNLSFSKKKWLSMFKPTMATNTLGTTIITKLDDNKKN